MEEEEESSLFNITLEPELPADELKVPRDHQSEEDFQKVKLLWKPKSETGELAKELQLPIQKPTKQESQLIMHAIEELYYLRRYEEAEKVTAMALRGQLQEDYKKVLLGYQKRCLGKIGMNTK